MFAKNALSYRQVDQVIPNRGRRHEIGGVVVTHPGRRLGPGEVGRDLPGGSSGRNNNTSESRSFDNFSQSLSWLAEIINLFLVARFI
jgi:hypothetical protein